jgi:hypothetical protein
MKHIVHFLQTFWLIFGITLLLILSLEIPCRGILLLYHFYHTDNKNEEIDYRVNGYKKNNLWVNDYFNEFHSSYITEWKPYIYWRRKPFTGKYINIDQQGIRYTKQWTFPKNETQRVIKIFMFGGSTLWGTGARDDYTIPSLLGKFLSEHAVNVKITNFGELGYVNTQEVIYLFLQLQKNNMPDIVVFYDGFNDVFSTFWNHKAGLTMSEFKKMESIRFGLLKQLSLKILRRSAICRLLGIDSNKLVNYNRAGLQHNEYHRNALDVVNIYLSNIKLVNEISCGRFISMFYWQPSIYDKINLTEYEKAQCRKDVKDFYKTVDAMIKLKASNITNYYFYNISDIFSVNSSPIFIDIAHLNETGNKLVALRMSNDILKIIEKNNLNKKFVRSVP